MKNLLTRIASSLGLSHRSAGDGKIFSFGTANDAGVPVTQETALTHSTVWACVMAISNDFSTLPVHVIRRETGDKEQGHAVHRVMHTSPNEFMAPAVFRSAMMLNALLWGRGVAVIERDTMGRPIGLYPVPTKHVHVERVRGLVRYHVRPVDGTPWTTLRPDEVFDLLWMSQDGVTAMGPIHYARHTVGLSLAVNRYASKFFANGGNVGGIIKTGGLTPDAVKQFVKGWKENYVGSDNAFKLAALPEGMDFTPIGTDPNKGQMLDTRKNQVLEICRIFGVPPHKVQDYSSMKWASIEHSQIEWAQSTLLHWAVRWEQEAERKLFLERERDLLDLSFNLDALLRADTESRYRTHEIAIRSGWSVNERRALEGRPPVKDGDLILRPGNLVPLNHRAPEPAKQERTDEPETEHAAT